jgi:hypothetical protein
MSTENNEAGGSLADRITKPDEASQPAPTTGTSSNPQLLRALLPFPDNHCSRPCVNKGLSANHAVLHRMERGRWPT